MASQYAGHPWKEGGIRTAQEQWHTNGKSELNRFNRWAGLPILRVSPPPLEGAGRPCYKDNFKDNYRDNYKETLMAGSIYKVIELVGTSEKSWEAAAKNAVETAGKTLKDLRVAEIKDLDMKVEKGKVVAYRAKVSLSFKYDA